MDSRSFRQAILALSSPDALSVLRAMRDGEWHLSSDLARDLDVHTTSVSKLLQHLASLHLVDQRPRSERATEYRLASPRVVLELDLADESGLLRQAIDFYVTYFHTLVDRINRLGVSSIESEIQREIASNHAELRAAIFNQMLSGDDGGLPRLRDLAGSIHQSLWSVCLTALGRREAQRLFKAALREAVGAYPDLAVRSGLVQPLSLPWLPRAATHSGSVPRH